MVVTATGGKKAASKKKASKKKASKKGSSKKAPAKKPAKPKKGGNVQAPEDKLKRIYVQHDVVDAARRRWEASKAETRSLKEDYEAASQRLEDIIDEARTGQGTLFDGADPEPKGAETKK